jgi:hypothetical protein
MTRRRTLVLGAIFVGLLADLRVGAAQSTPSQDVVSWDGKNLRIAGGAARGRSVTARGSNLEISVPGASWPPQELVVRDSLLAEVRVRMRAAYGLVVLRLRQRADTALGTLELRTAGADLLVGFGKRAEAPAAEASEGAPAASSPRALAPTQRAGEERAVAVAGVSPTPTRARPATEPYWRRGTPPAASSTGSSAAARLATVLIGAGLCAALWIWRRRQRGNGRQAETVGVEVLWARALSPKHKLVLVRVGSERLLLGCAEDRITLLRSEAAGGGEAHPSPAGRGGGSAHGGHSAPVAEPGEGSRTEPSTPPVDVNFEQRLELEIGRLRTQRAAATAATEHRRPSRQAAPYGIRAAHLVGHIRQSLADRQAPSVAREEPATSVDTQAWADDILQLRRARDERRRAGIAI